MEDVFLRCSVARSFAVHRVSLSCTQVTTNVTIPFAAFTSFAICGSSFLS